MEENNIKEFDFVVVKYDKDNYKLIEQVYRLHKDQHRKIFDLASNISTDEDIMDYIEMLIKSNDTLVFAAIDKDTEDVAAVLIMSDICLYNNTVVRTNCHLVVCRKYWGKTSRDIIKQFFNKMDNEFIAKVIRYEAYVPSNNFGIIKLLKDVGFKCEGTLKDRLVFYNKDGKPKKYDELIFSKINKGVEIDE